MRMNFGKWSRAGVPHKGWSCTDIYDLGGDDEMKVCEMCEVTKIRYVHVMAHADYPEKLEVGCICAGHMEENSKAATERERVYKQQSRQRANWLSRKWRTSAAGNHYINSSGFNVVVVRGKRGWGGHVTHGATSQHKSLPSIHLTRDAAKLAALETMTEMKTEIKMKTEMKQHYRIEGEGRFTILAGHPYFRLARPDVRQDGGGTWEVRWRNFYTMMRNRCFDSEARARAFAETVCKPPITVVDEGNFTDADQRWWDLDAF